MGWGIELARMSYVEHPEESTDFDPKLLLFLLSSLGLSAIAYERMLAISYDQALKDADRQLVEKLSQYRLQSAQQHNDGVLMVSVGGALAVAADCKDMSRRRFLQYAVAAGAVAGGVAFGIGGAREKEQRTARPEYGEKVDEVRIMLKKVLGTDSLSHKVHHEHNNPHASSMFPDIAPGSNLLVVPGAYPGNAPDEIEWFRSYIETFLIARGASEQNAHKLFNSYAYTMRECSLSHKDESIRFKELMTIMSEHGVYMLSWPLFAEEGRYNPLSKSLAMSALIQMIEGDVYTVGYSAGAASTRAMLKAFQEGWVDVPNLKGALLIGDPNLGFLNAPVYEMRTMLGLRTITREKAEEIYQMLLSTPRLREKLKTLPKDMVVQGILTAFDVQVPPPYSDGLSGGPLRDKGCSLAVMSARTDPIAQLSGIPHASHYMVDIVDTGESDFAIQVNGITVYTSVSSPGVMNLFERIPTISTTINKEGRMVGHTFLPTLGTLVF